jgi:hypothetical protein
MGCIEVLLVKPLISSNHPLLLSLLLPRQVKVYFHLYPHSKWLHGCVILIVIKFYYNEDGVRWEEMASFIPASDKWYDWSIHFHSVVRLGDWFPNNLKDKMHNDHVLCLFVAHIKLLSYTYLHPFTITQIHCYQSFQWIPYFIINKSWKCKKLWQFYDVPLHLHIHSVSLPGQIGRESDAHKEVILPHIHEL